MRIALVAHDSKKKLLENLCLAYRHVLIKHELFATGTTGGLIEEALGVPVTKYLSGQLGGEYQLGAQITAGNIDMVLFLRDPHSPKSYEPDINNLLKLCDIHNVPLASNLAATEALLSTLGEQSPSSPEHFAQV